MNREPREPAPQKAEDVTRRAGLSLALCVATLGAAIGMRPGIASAQDPRARAEGKGEGKMMGKEMRHEGKQERTGAHFRFEKDPAGNASIDIQCADNEPTQSCVNAASALLDKISGLPAPRP